MDFINYFIGRNGIQFPQAVAQAGDDAVLLWQCRWRVSGRTVDAADRDIKKRGLRRTAQHDIPGRLQLFLNRGCAVQDIAGNICAESGAFISRHCCRRDFRICDDSCGHPSGGTTTPVLDLEKDIFKEGYKI